MIELEETHFGIPITEPCRCVLARDAIRNLERGWKGVAYAEKIEDSPLLEYVNQDLYITANDAILRSHLKYVGVRQGRNWSFLVTTDADLMKAWLFNAKEKGQEIYDQEMALALAQGSASASKRSLEALVDPPGLLVVRLGVKIARNAAMHEVFHEALTRRDHENMPTWVVDQPNHRLNAPDAFGNPHRSYSEAVMEYIDAWTYFDLQQIEVVVQEEKGEVITEDGEVLPTKEDELREAKEVLKDMEDDVVPAPTGFQSFSLGGGSLNKSRSFEVPGSNTPTKADKNKYRSRK